MAGEELEAIARRVIDSNQFMTGPPSAWTAGTWWRGTVGRWRLVDQGHDLLVHGSCIRLDEWQTFRPRVESSGQRLVLARRRPRLTTLPSRG
jgi:hypothetical protein